MNVGFLSQFFTSAQSGFVALCDTSAITGSNPNLTFIGGYLNAWTSTKCAFWIPDTLS